MENKVLRTQFELTELRISAYLVMEITVNDAAPKRPMQIETGGAGCAGGETPSKLLPGEDFKSRFRKDAAFFHFKVPLKRVRRRSGPRGISDQTPVDIKERMGCVFTQWCLFEVKDQEAAGRLPSLCVAPGNSAELPRLMSAEKLPHSLDLVSL